ncbi:MAG: helix-turn-helix domain-containing protein [bacterium]|nr:helix-turn-helix domain-containing protein [bacterium]
MAENLQKLLEGIGFDDKEAAVYLACLELDGGSNTQISKRTGLNRITNYEILKRLERKGIVREFLKRHTKHFMAVDPRIVIKQTKEKLLLAELAMPEFLAGANKIAKKPRIYFFEGIGGIKSIYDDSLNSKTEILTFTNPKDIESILGKKYVDRYVYERVKQNIVVRGLAPDDPAGRHAKAIGEVVLRKARVFPEEKYNISNEIMIYDDKIAIFSGKDKIGLIIENKDLSDTFRNIWKMSWDNARTE